MHPFDIKAALLAKHAQHVVLIHFPIALFIAGVAFDFMAQWTKRATYAAAAYFNFTFAALSTIPVVITAYQDKSFSFVVKTPPATVLIKKAAGIESGSKTPHTDQVGKITRAQAEEIAKIKMPDLTAADLDAAVRTIAGSARSMGVTV